MKRRFTKASEPGRRIPSVLLTLVAGVLLSTVPMGCHSVSGTGRTQLNAYSINDEIVLGNEAYAEMLEAVTLVTSGPQYRMVIEVTRRISAAAERLHPEMAHTDGRHPLKGGPSGPWDGPCGPRGGPAGVLRGPTCSSAEIGGVLREVVGRPQGPQVARRPWI